MTDRLFNAQEVEIMTQAFSSGMELDDIPVNHQSEIDDDGMMETQSNQKLSLENSPSIKKTACPILLSQWCFLVGHVAIKQIVHLEAIESEWKRKKYSDEQAKTKSGDKKVMDDLENVVGTAEDEFTDAIHHVRERELLYGDSLLCVFAPMIAFICSNNRQFKHPMIQVQAVLALSKFMCVSSDFCDTHLPLLLLILEKSEDAVIRSNTIIGLGDIAVCFNSLIDQNITYLYNRLSDTDIQVKKNTLMVLTFLILNGMVKVKGQISEMAKCLECEDKRIADLAKLFFTELSTKDNAVYNNLSDIISNLSHPETGVDEDSFKNIMKFLLDFIKKDKQTENIVEKMCLRFKFADTERQWRDISYCLSLLSLSSDKSIKRLIDFAPLYQDKMHEPTVYNLFQKMFEKAKKLAKPDSKSMIEDFETKLNQMNLTCSENMNLVEQASQDQTKGKFNRIKDVEKNFASLSLAGTPIKPKKVFRKVVDKQVENLIKGKKKTTRRIVQESEDDDDHQVFNMEEEEVIVKTARNPRGRSRPISPEIVNELTDDEDDIENFDPMELKETSKKAAKARRKSGPLKISRLESLEE